MNFLLIAALILSGVSQAAPQQPKRSKAELTPATAVEQLRGASSEKAQVSLRLVDRQDLLADPTVRAAVLTALSELTARATARKASNSGGATAAEPEPSEVHARLNLVRVVSMLRGPDVVDVLILHIGSSATAGRYVAQQVGVAAIPRLVGLLASGAGPDTPSLIGHGALLTMAKIVRARVASSQLVELRAIANTHFASTDPLLVAGAMHLATALGQPDQVSEVMRVANGDFAGLRSFDPSHRKWLQSAARLALESPGGK